jgi:hypothetical protein
MCMPEPIAERGRGRYEADELRLHDSPCGLFDKPPWRGRERERRGEFKGGGEPYSKVSTKQRGWRNFTEQNTLRGISGM